MRHPERLPIIRRRGREFNVLKGKGQVFMIHGARKLTVLVRQVATPFLVALAVFAIAGCNRQGEQRLRAEVQVILSERPVDKVLEPDPKSLREVFTYEFEGQGKLRAVTRYESTRLRAMADRDKGAVHVFRRELQFAMYEDMVLEASASPLGTDKLKIDFWVSPEACCGMTMSADVVVGAETVDKASDVMFTCDWPSGRRMLIELPSKRLKGRWIWVLIDLQKEESKPVDPRKG